MPSAVRMLLTVMSMTTNGRKIRKPIWKASVRSPDERGNEQSKSVTTWMAASGHLSRDAHRGLRSARMVCWLRPASMLERPETGQAQRADSFHVEGIMRVESLQMVGRLSAWVQRSRELCATH